MEEKKVLIVDDQNGIRILLMEVFSSEGYKNVSGSQRQNGFGNRPQRFAGFGASRHENPGDGRVGNP
ncbi:hypothetical protein HMSSN139_62950 [Paenibacillus sp. HMSSN-139]|nr:hypothetical protein HMSSN139_62950 [Paenibacillus sp. HMSSN-139]